MNKYEHHKSVSRYRNKKAVQESYPDSKKNISEMKEGVVVNSLIKDSNCPNIENMYDSLIIPDRTTKPDSFEKLDTQHNQEKKKSQGKALVPLLGTTTALLLFWPVLWHC